jgi:hypothetical protein
LRGATVRPIGRTGDRKAMLAQRLRMPHLRSNANNAVPKGAASA